MEGVLNFKFRKVFTVSYSNITDTTSLPTTALDGKSLTVTFTNSPPNGVTVKMNNEDYTDFTYTNHILTIQNVTGDIQITGTNGEVVISNGTTTITNNDVNGMTFDEFTNTTFYYVNNSGSSIKSIAFTVTANVIGSGNQYLYPTIVYNGTTKTTNTAAYLQATSSSNAQDVTSRSVSMNVNPRLADQTEFTLKFDNRQTNTRITVNYIVSYTMTITYQ